MHGSPAPEGKLPNYHLCWAVGTAGSLFSLPSCLENNCFGKIGLVSGKMFCQEICFSLVNPCLGDPDWSCSSNGKLPYHWPGTYISENRKKILCCNKADEEAKQPVSCFVAHKLRLSAIFLPSPATITTATTGGGGINWEHEGSKKAQIFSRIESKRLGTVCFKTVINNKHMLILQCVIILWHSFPQGSTGTRGLAGYTFRHNKKIICRKIKPPNTFVSMLHSIS